MNKFPDFGEELKRPFEVCEHCYDCTEFYDGCNAWPASKSFRCAYFFPLPDAGVNGVTGQEIPPSRMNGRKEPRAIGDDSGTESAEPRAPRQQVPTRPAPEPLPKTTMRSSHERTPSPASRPGPEGKRLCDCGAALLKRRRCCDECRLKRREEAVRRWQDQKHPAAALDAASDMPFPAVRGHFTVAGSPVDN